MSEPVCAPLQVYVKAPEAVSVAFCPLHKTPLELITDTLNDCTNIVIADPTEQFVVPLSIA